MHTLNLDVHNPMMGPSTHIGLNFNEGDMILFPSTLNHCTQCTSDKFDGERLAIVGDVTLVYKEDGANDYSMGYINPKYWRIYK